MNLRKILLAAAGLGIMILNTSAQTSKRYTVAKPGTLVEMLTEDEANEITHLVLQGKLNAIDFRHLRDEFKKLQILDISNASISMYAGKNGTHPDRFYIYPANCIPSYAFCKQLSDSTFIGKTSLTQVILSDKTKNIEDGAFKGCTNLKYTQKNSPELAARSPGRQRDSHIRPSGQQRLVSPRQTVGDICFHRRRTGGSHCTDSYDGQPCQRTDSRRHTAQRCQLPYGRG